MECLTARQRPSEAVPLLRAMLAACATPGEEGFLIGSLVRNACSMMTARGVERLLALSEPGEELRTLLAPLCDSARGNGLFLGMRGERAFADGMYLEFESNPEALPKQIEAMRKASLIPEVPTVRLEQYTPFLKADHASEIRRWTAILKTFDLPLHERPAAIRKIDAEWSHPEHTLDDVWPKLVESKTDQIVSAEQRAVAHLDCARVLVACDLLRLRENRWPKTLEEIPKDLLPEVPTDPFDGKPIRYRVLSDGIAVWSVGETFLEDPLNPKEGEEKPRVNLVFRAWNPDKRRMPAPPPRPELLHDPLELDEEQKEKE